MIAATTDIQYLKGVGEKRAVVLRNKGIDTGFNLHADTKTTTTDRKKQG